MLVYRHRDRNRRFSDVMLKSLGQSLAINVVIGLTSGNIDNWCARASLCACCTCYNALLWCLAEW